MPKDSLVLNFQERDNLERAKNAIEREDNLGVGAKVSNMIDPKIMLTYVEDLDENEEKENCSKLIEIIKRKNQHLSGVEDEDLKVIKIKKAHKSKYNKKHVILKCSPETRKKNPL